ncbi:metallophosphoesterase family protein [Aquincola sp. S2]|uniref:Metallophosphoesterase family protein n=1 Tax=Pseudaquabacterium terrae TaxID=2732868 RepID=A0ABX2EH00_9BURK|nr:metallophosphoesterase family protein [Aquabacterium terrae]NRF67885.1 metallophosphoesterase family protein [Aquabacterium terrae]
MKTALLSDLHANREAVEAVLEHAHAHGAQAYVLLGDFVGYGADPGWVVDEVRALVRGGALAVQGNHDRAVVLGPTATMRPEPRRVVEWTRNQLDAAQIDFLASLPLQQQQGDRLYVHANAWAPSEWEYIVGRTDAVRSLHATRCRYTFCGHMHEPKLYHLSSVGKCGDFVPTPGVAIPVPPHRQWLIIPGSAGQPRDGNPAAAYAIFDDAEHSITYHRVPYDHEAAGAKIRAADLPQRLASRLEDGQ